MRTDCKNDRNKIGGFEVTLSIRGTNQMHRDQFQRSEIFGTRIDRRNVINNGIAATDNKDSQLETNPVWNSTLLHSKLKSKR